MSATAIRGPEKTLQAWVWKGLEENFKPDGNITIDENGDDVFVGHLFVGTNEIEINHCGLVLENLPQIIIATLVGRRLDEIIQLPPCGNDELDAKVSSMLIKSIYQVSNTKASRTQIVVS